MPSITNIVKGFLDVANAAQSIADKARILDLISQVQQMSAELDSLKEENKMLREQLAKRKKMERICGVCYILEDDGAKPGPICPQCYAEDGIVCCSNQIRMARRAHVAAPVTRASPPASMARARGFHIDWSPAPARGHYHADLAPWEGVSANRKAHGVVNTQRRVKTENGPPHGGLSRRG